MKFRLLGSTGGPLQHADAFADLDFDCLRGVLLWELWADEQCLAQVDMRRYVPSQWEADVIEKVKSTVEEALPNLSWYVGKVLVRVGECFRPFAASPYFRYLAPHDPNHECPGCRARGWDPATRCPCCDA